VSEEYLTPADASEYLKRRFGIGAPRWLAKLRCIGGGPRYRRIGRRVLYKEQDLYNWASAQLGKFKGRPRKEAAALAPGSIWKAC
jgi:hypothetical protein